MGKGTKKTYLFSDEKGLYRASYEQLTVFKNP
jgi:hypothetical protein